MISSEQHVDAGGDFYLFVDGDSDVDGRHHGLPHLVDLMDPPGPVLHRSIHGHVDGGYPTTGRVRRCVSGLSKHENKFLVFSKFLSTFTSKISRNA